VRLHLLLAEERVLLAEMLLVCVALGVDEARVRLEWAVDRRAVSVVARRAAELLGRMVAQVERTVRVRLPRVRLVLEAGLVDPGMARRAPLDAADRLLVRVAIELLEHDLLDLRDLPLPVHPEEWEALLRAGVVAERHGLELRLKVVALRRELRERVLGLVELALLVLDLLLRVGDALLRVVVDLLALRLGRLA